MDFGVVYADGIEPTDTDKPEDGKIDSEEVNQSNIEEVGQPSFERSNESNSNNLLESKSNNPEEEELDSDNPWSKYNNLWDCGSLDYGRVESDDTGARINWDLIEQEPDNKRKFVSDPEDESEVKDNKRR
jgi:hypothetical protein